jgi:uncharacterized protein (DUF1810 family)
MCPNPPEQSADRFHLERFVEAQQPVYREVLQELQAGEKVSHWMWFIFPQIRGLGRSPVSIEFAISGREEALAYLQHRILGPRLKECTQMVLLVEGRSAFEIFGSPDDVKFRSCMTLFAEVSSEDDIFKQALRKYFNGVPDSLTLEHL